MTATIGQKAPDFQLPSHDKNMVTLGASKGKNVVLLFFPAAFTSTCTKELCQTRDELSFFGNLNAEVFGISVDMPFTLTKFRADNNLNFSLLSDFNKEAITAYGCKYDTWILGLKGVAKRSSFVIDKEGIIRFAEILENASDYPDFDGIKKTLEGLK
jgi:glutaredoxin-dependent peroxiredoxin